MASDNWLTPLSKGNGGDSEHWLSVADLMAGLMMVFLFISVALMRQAFIERDKIKQVAVAYQENQVAIYQALQREFTGDLQRWGAEIDQATLSFNFHAPEVLFDTGEITLKAAYQQILDDFFPRYLAVLAQYRSSIEEVRIEGHTSSVWNRFVSDEQAYFHNMALSQGRTRSVLDYIYRLPTVVQQREWIKKHIAAVGLSSSQPVLAADGNEDLDKSRRVSFRVVTNSEIQIRRILLME